MSWDLVFWKGAPLEGPPAVWSALADEQAVLFITPLCARELQRAFAGEYGEEIGADLDGDGLRLMGRGWEGSLRDGDKYLYLTCAWGLAKDDEWLTQIVRAGLRAGCWVFDPQSGCWWEPVAAAEWLPEEFDVWDSARSADDD